MFLVGFLLIVGLGVLFYYLSRGRHPEDMIRRYPKDEDPLEIARRRYARGEITKEEFEEIKTHLYWRG